MFNSGIADSKRLDSKSANPHIMDFRPARLIAACKPESDTQHLLAQFIACIVGGALLGAVAAFAVLKPDLDNLSLTGAVMSYAAFGAAAGSLMAGLWDVIVGGRLEDSE